MSDWGCLALGGGGGTVHVEVEQQRHDTIVDGSQVACVLPNQRPNQGEQLYVDQQ